MGPIPVETLGCGGLAVAALAVALEAVRRYVKLAKRMKAVEKG